MMLEGTADHIVLVQQVEIPGGDGGCGIPVQRPEVGVVADIVFDQGRVAVGLDRAIDAHGRLQLCWFLLTLKTP